MLSTSSSKHETRIVCIVQLSPVSRRDKMLIGSSWSTTDTQRVYLSQNMHALHWKTKLQLTPRPVRKVCAWPLGVPPAECISPAYLRDSWSYYQPLFDPTIATELWHWNHPTLFVARLITVNRMRSARRGWINSIWLSLISRWPRTELSRTDGRSVHEWCDTL